MIPAEINMGEEKKDDSTPFQGKGSGGRQSVSQQRARAAGSAGLSELSKQLRIYQAKNEAQAVEINRLERQLRILAELQGISVADLRKALEDACANEAFGELQNRVSKLRAELEAATLAKHAELRKGAAGPHIANLELRVGELEEVEERQQQEIEHLYEQLRHERARSTRLEAENEELRRDARVYLERLKNEGARAAKLEAEFQEKLRKLEEEYLRKMQSDRQNGQGADFLTSMSPEMAADYQRMMQAMKEKDEELQKLRKELKAEQDRALQQMQQMDKQRQNHVDSKVDQEQMALLIKQLQDADGQNELRLAQYKTRFAVQDERLNDMEQQLKSLYTAFGLLQEEQDAENMKRKALKNSLDEADAVIARQVNNKQKQKQKEQQKQAKLRNTPTRKKKAPPTLPNTPETVTSSGSMVDASTPTARAIGDPISSLKPRTGVDGGNKLNTWQLVFPKDYPSPFANQTYYSEEPDDNGLLISGLLVVKSKNMVKNYGRKWKTKVSRLYLSGDHFQWDLGEGKSYSLQFGISKVEFNPNHPLSFDVYVDPSDSESTVVHAAASCEEDYYRWMSALTKVTNGGEYQRATGPARIPSLDQELQDMERAMALSRQDLNLHHQMQ